MLAEFTDDLVTGNEAIDSQHRELIGKINDLLVSCEDRANRSGAARMLNFLADYTDYHFKAEEALQKEIGYPGLKEHIKKHDELRTAVDELYEMLSEEEGPSENFVHAVNKKITDWLYNHIRTFDRSVAEYTLAKKNA